MTVYYHNIIHIYISQHAEIRKLNSLISESRTQFWKGKWCVWGLGW